MNKRKSFQKACSHCSGTGSVTDHSLLGKYLQEQRKKAKKTLREVAEFMVISVSYLSDLEHGRKKWNQTLILLFTMAIG